MAERVLVTGATGFIGSHALKPLLDRGYEVHALGRRAGAAQGVAFHEVDLLDARAADALVRELGASHLLHMAWYTEHGRFWEAPENLDWVGATLTLLRAFAGAGGRRAVLAGTCAEYDWSEPLELYRELPSAAGHATPELPATLYGAAKQATRIAAGAYARSAGLSVAWGRVFLLYGPGEDRRRLVPSVADALLAGREAPTSDGLQIRDLMHVEDVAGAFAALLDSDVEGPVNVASGHAVSLLDVLELIAAATGRPELLRAGALPRRPGEPERLVAATERLREEVGFRPRVELAAGIAATVEWRRSQGSDG
jgi:nucleoside-diphosphate-sugar epimerase